MDGMVILRRIVVPQQLCATLSKNDIYLSGGLNDSLDLSFLQSEEPTLKDYCRV